MRKFEVVTKAVAAYLITGQSNRIGLFNFSPAQAAEDLGMLPKRFQKRFGEVLHGLNYSFDEEARVLYLPTWWKYNAPENSNVLKGNLKDLDDIPETALIMQFCENLDYLDQEFHQTFHEGIAKPSSKRYPQHSPNQKQKQDQDQEQDQEQDAAGTAALLVLSPAQIRKRSRTEYSPEFERAFAIYPSRPGNSKVDAYKAWCTRIREGVAPTEMLAGIERYARYVRESGKSGTEYIKLAATFFGPKDFWKESWAIADSDGVTNGNAPTALPPTADEFYRGAS